jgi:pyruvate,orthophosphate dikinase
MSNKWVYSFGAEYTEGKADMRELLGGKGANLAEMCSIGLPVPSGFTITTEVCTFYYNNDNSYPSELEDQVLLAIKKLEEQMGALFGDAKNPLLVSVRSGARVSMPGMMDTVLNLGLNDDTVEGLAEISKDERFAWDSYRRFIQMYGDVVLGVPHHDFEDVIETHKRDEDITEDTQISAEGWKSIVKDYKQLVQQETGEPFPSDPFQQLWGAIGAVFGSWMTARAVTYRHIHDIPSDWGTAVNIQSMVFGNMGEDCATGVAFTRDPATGENYFYGEFLINAQGEDVVAGIRTPQPLTLRGKEKEGSTLSAMEEVMPHVFKQLDEVRHKLEKHYLEMQDVEFTVQKNKLYMLQTRAGKRTTAAALKIAVDMQNEGMITKEEALLRIDPMGLDQLLHPTLDPMAHKTIIAKGLTASPGAASGHVVFSADEAEEKAAQGQNVILCRRETSPEDIHGMHAAVGILTSRGGMTSHAAVVARGMGRACVAGAGAIHIDYKEKLLKVGEYELKEGDLITIDGSTGEVMAGEVDTVQPQLSGDFSTIMKWADEHRRMSVRTNAETAHDAKIARDFGASGIGLCRTEHMFFEPDRIQRVREMIFATSAQYRRDALKDILPLQRDDFIQLFEIMQGLPVTIRLLDPPLNEFLPVEEEDIKEFAKASGFDITNVKHRLAELHEANPMLGHRGCRLGITYPEIYEMQVRAILEAAIIVHEKTGQTVIPEIKVPLVAKYEELAQLKTLIDDTAKEVFEEKQKEIDYLVGAMIELPRAALTADQLAKVSQFFSFGTNDLTQTALGLSRDDSSSFLPEYLQSNIFEKDPFISIDREGVGQLIEIAVEKSRAVDSSIKLGICGEHGGDPSSIEFCELIGLDYVSCSPYRVPIARLAAAQSSIKQAKLISNHTKKKAA